MIQVSIKKTLKKGSFFLTLESKEVLDCPEYLSSKFLNEGFIQQQIYEKNLQLKMKRFNEQRFQTDKNPDLR